VRYYTAWPEAEADGDDDESSDEDGSDSDSDNISLGTTTTDGGGFGKSTDRGLDFISSSGYPKVEFGGSDGESDDNDGAIVFGSDSGK
jgi:translation initiation factor 2-alpha kinase 4